MTASHTTLTPEQLVQLRDELQRTRSRIERSMRANGGHTEEMDASAVGRLSRIEALQNQELARDLHERERVQLDQVLQALHRIESGSYGFCSSCRGPIRFERLLIFPETHTCTLCGAD